MKQYKAFASQVQVPMPSVEAGRGEEKGRNQKQGQWDEWMPVTIQYLLIQDVLLVLEYFCGYFHQVILSKRTEIMSYTYWT